MCAPNPQRQPAPEKLTQLVKKWREDAGDNFADIPSRSLEACRAVHHALRECANAIEAALTDCQTPVVAPQPTCGTCFEWKQNITLNQGPDMGKCHFFGPGLHRNEFCSRHTAKDITNEND